MDVDYLFLFFVVIVSLVILILCVREESKRVDPHTSFKNTQLVYFPSLVSAIPCECRYLFAERNNVYIDTLVVLW